MNQLCKTIAITLFVLITLAYAVQAQTAQTFDYFDCEAPGDVNHDGTVDFSDTTLVAQHLFFGTTFDGRCTAAADMNRDGEVTVFDLVDTHLYGTAVVPTTYACTSIPADIDGDCVVDYLDALAASYIDAGLATLQPGDITSCDVRTDGRVDILDALLIGQITEGLVPSIPRTCDAYTACSDTIDNDGDGLVDLDDPDCENADDDDEGDGQGFIPRCADGIDNDGDGLVDLDDPGCESLLDDDERDITPSEPTACNDGIDNDGDGFIDLFDTGCSSAEDDDESDGPTQGSTQCSDSVDNDGDMLIDYPADPDCDNAADDDESDGSMPPVPACSDGIDNDNDGLIDLADPGCTDANDDDEHQPGHMCDDGIDNDLDGLIDLDDPDCNNDPRDPGEGEAPACSDGVDNDLDGLTDYPADPDCDSPTDTGEGSLGAPRAAEPSEPDARIFVSNLALVEPYDFLAGRALRTSLTFSNVGEVTLHHVKARVAIPALGVLRTVGPFTFHRGEEMTQLVTLDVPGDVAPGIYDVRITIHADEEGAQRTIHRVLEITSDGSNQPSQQPIVHYVTTVYCPAGYSSCQAVPL